MSKLTPWYPPEVKPVRVGVYESITSAPPWFRYWDGSHWHWGARTVEEAFKNREACTVVREAWRGLTREAK